MTETTTPDRPQVAEGPILAVVECPKCGVVCRFPADLQAVLKVTTDEGSLTVRLRAKPVMHTCGQLALDVHTGEIL